MIMGTKMDSLLDLHERIWIKEWRQTSKKALGLLEVSKFLRRKASRQWAATRFQPIAKPQRAERTLTGPRRVERP